MNLKLNLKLEYPTPTCSFLAATTLTSSLILELYSAGIVGRVLTQFRVD